MFYPGLETHEGHDIAKKQMPGGFGGMVSFVIEGGASAALKVRYCVIVGRCCHGSPAFIM